MAYLRAVFAFAMLKTSPEDVKDVGEWLEQKGDVRLPRLVNSAQLHALINNDQYPKKFLHVFCRPMQVFMARILDDLNYNLYSPEHELLLPNISKLSTTEPVVLQDNEVIDALVSMLSTSPKLIFIDISTLTSAQHIDPKGLGEDLKSNIRLNDGDNTDREASRTFSEPFPCVSFSQRFVL